jgi:hypothetical protein
MTSDTISENGSNKECYLLGRDAARVRLNMDVSVGRLATIFGVEEEAQFFLKET